MPSSTLLFEPGPPGLARKILGFALLAWAGCAAYTLWLNPSVGFFRHAARVKQDYIRQLDAARTNKVLVYGGSSCAFAINAAAMLREQGVPAVNMGLAADYGALFLTRWTLSTARPGDTVIMALEPGLLTRPFQHSSEAVQISYALGQPGLLRDLDGSSPLSFGSQLLRLRPDAQHVLTLVGKLAARRPLFRYRTQDVRPDGWVTTTVRMPVSGPPMRGPHLSPDARRLLAELRDWGQGHGLRLAYSLPRGFAPDAEIGAFRRSNAAFLGEIAEFLPVLKDDSLGASSRPEDFADTNWHLTEQAALARSLELAGQIKSWSVWSATELAGAAGASTTATTP
jgi:hypothetical protein